MTSWLVEEMEESGKDKELFLRAGPSCLLTDRPMTTWLTFDVAPVTWDQDECEQFLREWMAELRGRLMASHAYHAYNSQRPLSTPPGSALP